MSGASNSTSTGPKNGIIGGVFDVYGQDRTIPRSMTAFTAIAWYNCIVILVLILFVFKRYSGLYFWSLLITTLAVVPYATGAWMKQNSVSRIDYLTEGLLTVGWVTMIPGQSLVLYSRLHLITLNYHLLRFILWLIILDTVFLIPTSVILAWTGRFGHIESSVHGYGVFEKIQMTIFTVQELIISGTYLWEIRKIFNVIFKGKTKNILWQVVAFNILIICLDSTLLTIEFFNLYMIETTFKSLVYSVKILVEFGVLSRMVNVVKGRNKSEGTHSTAVDEAVPGAVRNADPEKYSSMASSEPFQSPMSSKRTGRVSQSPVRDEERELRGLQQNVPTNWRMSIGHESLSAPDLIEIRRNRRSSTGSLPSSTDGWYPGRLGGKNNSQVTIHSDTKVP